MTSTTPLRTMVIDDESLARQRLKRLLAAHPEVHVVGEASDGPTARDQIAILKPTLLFLDVSMPGEDGFAMLADLPPELRPFVVFVTAHADAAVRAFDARATDFLVKPVEPERLAEAVTRAVEAVSTRAPATSANWPGELRAELARLLSAAPAAAPLHHFAVTVGRRTRFIPVDDVLWFTAEGNYIRLHCGAEQHLIRQTMQKLESDLDRRHFARIHRSIIVKLSAIKELVMDGPGDYRVLLRDGTSLEVMRSYRDRLPLG
jgi:two-component system, LytTR family, response regulator